MRVTQDLLKVDKDYRTQISDTNQVQKNFTVEYVPKIVSVCISGGAWVSGMSGVDVQYACGVVVSVSVACRSVYGGIVCCCCVLARECINRKSVIILILYADVLKIGGNKTACN